MTGYTPEAYSELKSWQKKMLRRPSLINRLSKRTQTKINSFIPEKVHAAITAAIKQMVKVVLFGAGVTTSKLNKEDNFEIREKLILERIKWYKTTAAAEGGITGAGGILLGLADFPLLFGIKIKLLFDIATMYGFDVKDYKERIYILYIMQLAFSSQEERRNVYLKIENWNEHARLLPDNINRFDWRTFQQEYRDYLDLAKMAQLIPLIGAPVGVIVNYRLITKLGETAMNAYRMRLLQ
jgi:EcsC protein family